MLNQGIPLGRHKVCQLIARRQPLHGQQVNCSRPIVVVHPCLLRSCPRANGHGRFGPHTNPWELVPTQPVEASLAAFSCTGNSAQKGKLRDLPDKGHRCWPMHNLEDTVPQCFRGFMITLGKPSSNLLVKILHGSRMKDLNIRVNCCGHPTARCTTDAHRISFKEEMPLLDQVT